MPFKIHSWPAFFAFLICSLVSLGVLFGPVVYHRNWSSVGLVHMYVVLCLVVAITAGFFLHDEKSGWMKVGWAALFVIGTFGGVALSGGRGKAVLEGNVASVKEQIDKRADLQSRLDAANTSQSKARQELKKRQDAYDAQVLAAAEVCKSGNGPQCKGSAITTKSMLDERDEAKRALTDATVTVSLAQRLLDDAPTGARAPNAEFEGFVNLYVYIKNASVDDARDAINLLLPYLFSLVAEYGAIMFALRAFHPSGAPVVSQQPATASDQAGTSHRSIGDIARALRLEPKVARKQARALGITKSPLGWQWPAAEAAQIEQRIALARSGTQGNA